ncbi:hypothetical protein D3C73_1391690 [compost metagenome]
MKTKRISIAAMLLTIVIVAGTVTVFATSALDKTEPTPGVESPAAESTPALGESSIALMPIDLTFTK